MLFVTLEDTDGKIELLVFPKVLETTGTVWTDDKIILASGRVSDKDGNFKILVDKAKAVNQQEVENLKRILATQKSNGASTGSNKSKLMITLPVNFEKETLKKLSQFFDSCQGGGMKVYLAINGARLETPYCISYLDGLEETLSSMIPEVKIDIQ